MSKGNYNKLTLTILKISTLRIKKLLYSKNLWCNINFHNGCFFSWQYDLKIIENRLNQAQKRQLRNSFEFKQQRLILALKQQLKDIEETFGDLLKRLPSKSEIAELLVDISQQGLGAGLEFELFKPGDERPRDFYAEVPIEIKVVGSYHQFGNFISGVSDLPRIVTNNKLKIYKDKKEGDMILETTAKTYRYFDDEGNNEN